MIDVQRLRVLREVSRHGSFSKAAAALRYTPSAVSQQIAALERTLGAAVVDRSPRGVVLTESGRVLVEAADTISAELEQAQAEIERLATGRASLTIATFTSGGQRLLPAALNRFTAEHPEVELTILEHEPEESLPLVRQGAADVALAYHFAGPPPARVGDRSGLVWTPLLDDPMWVVLPRTHPLARRTSLRLTHFADLTHERWIQGCIKTEDVLRPYATLAGFEFRVACTATNYHFAQSLVAAGLGIALIPQVALGPCADAVVAVPVEPALPARYIGVATAKRRGTRPHVEALLEALRTTAPW
jgi:molybdate transport repressor ModE-like protein